MQKNKKKNDLFRMVMLVLWLVIWGSVIERREYPFATQILRYAQDDTFETYIISSEAGLVLLRCE